MCKILKSYFVISILICVVNNLYAYDGNSFEFGPSDVHQLSIIGQNQPVLVIYVQATDHRILNIDLNTINNAENQKVLDFKNWFDETSWGETTLNVTQQRTTGDNWYTLPEGILDYVTPSSIVSMEARDATQASNNNPTPPASLSSNAITPASGDPDSDFDATEAGDYWYAASGFKNGVESKLTKIPSAVTISENEIVKLTITKPTADDIDRYIVYRTGRGQTDNISNFKRIGYADVTAMTDEYIDIGKSLSLLADHDKLLTDAMTAAAADVANYENYNGVIVIIYSSFLRGQSAGAYTFTVNGVSFKIQTINQSSHTGFGRFNHEIGHWLGLPDEYDPITTFNRGYWTTMDGSNDRQYASWEKEHLLNWIQNSSNIKYLQRPGPGQPDLNQSLNIVPTILKESSPNTYTAIKIKSSESVHYFVEGRNKVTGNVSDATATDKIVLMEAVDSWPPGIYPKRNLNEQKVMSIGDPTHSPDPSIEITYSSINTGTPVSYNVNVKIKAEERPDPKITPWGAPPWESSDIWIDSEREGSGWDDPATAVPKESNGEAAWVNHVNRVYTQISNVGQGDATNVKVRFRVNTPGGIGDAGQFIDLNPPAPVDIPAGSSRNVYAEWTPSTGAHTCIQVEIEHIPGEEDIYNNFAQENVTHFYSGSSSPWSPITFPVQVANPFEEPKRVELEIEGLVDGWKAKFENKWVYLEPKSIKTVNVRITPNPTDDKCTKLILDIYGMIQIDDYIQIYGGINPIIHLANPIEFNKLNVRPRTGDTGVEGDLFRVSGITSPRLDHVEIALIVTNPHNDDEVYFTTTDENGFFDATFPADQAGTWTAYTYYAGDNCNAPTESPRIAVQVDPKEKGLYPGWCCIIVIILLLVILILLLLIYRKTYYKRVS